jgi:hypothetical protein
VNRKHKKKYQNVNIVDFYKHFRDVNANDEDDGMHGGLHDVNVFETFDDSSFINEHITEHEIVKAVKCIKNNKSPGPDDINEYLKSSIHVMVPMYEKLFNLVFGTGIVLEEWLVGHIKPVYKNKGSEGDPHNC